MTRAILPWPYPALWPNARPHWAAKAKATSAYRFCAKAMLLNASVGPIRVTFCPKSKGPIPDRDNCTAAFKAGQDGIADALRVNDRDLSISYAFGERCKDGAVIVEIIPPQVEPLP